MTFHKPSVTRILHLPKNLLSTSAKTSHCIVTLSSGVDVSSQAQEKTMELCTVATSFSTDLTWWQRCFSEFVFVSLASQPSAAIKQDLLNRDI